MLKYDDVFMKWLTRSKAFSDPADILVYLWENYEEGASREIKGGRNSHFVLSRATKMIYLVDWKYASKYGRQATNVNWRFDRFGPYVNLVSFFTKRFDLREKSPNKKSPQCSKRWLFLKDEESKDTYDLLPSQVQEVCREVIGDVRTLSYLNFIQFAYGTSPVIYSARYSIIDIVKIAKHHKYRAPGEQDMRCISRFKRFFDLINHRKARLLISSIIISLFFVFPLIIVVLTVVHIFFANDRSVNLNFIKDMYQSFNNVGIIYMWGTGLILSLIAYFAFIHDKSKFDLESERERGRIDVEIQKREESLLELLAVRADKKYDLVQQGIIECRMLKHKHIKSDDESRYSPANVSPRLIYACIDWIQEIDWEWVSRVSDEGQNMYFDALHSSYVALTTEENRMINIKTIMDEIKKEAQSSTEEIVKLVNDRIHTLEEKIDVLKNFNKGLVDTYVYTYSRDLYAGWYWMPSMQFQQFVPTRYTG